MEEKSSKTKRQKAEERSPSGAPSPQRQNLVQKVSPLTASKTRRLRAKRKSEGWTRSLVLVSASRGSGADLCLLPFGFGAVGEGQPPPASPYFPFSTGCLFCLLNIRDITLFDMPMRPPDDFMILYMTSLSRFVASIQQQPVPYTESRGQTEPSPCIEMPWRLC